MVFLTACRRVARSNWLLWLLFSVLMMVFGLHSHIIRPLAEYKDGLNVPDTRALGYSAAELNLWYDQIEAEGCKIYIQGANWDFFPIMPVYPLFLGSMIVKLTGATDFSDAWAYLPFAGVSFDVVETYLQRMGCVQYPEKLPDEYIRVASNSCRMKWVFLLGSIFFIVALSIQTYRQQGTMLSRTSEKMD